MTRQELIEEAAFNLYAGGPWGEHVGWTDEGLTALTNAHRMDVYRRIVEDVLATVAYHTEHRDNQ